MRPYLWPCLVWLILAVSSTTYAQTPSDSARTDWYAYGSDAGGTHYAPLIQITPENVRQLQVAWTYRTGSYGVGESGAAFETTPLFVAGTLYLNTPLGRIIALDPVRGVERWSYDAHIDPSAGYGDFVSRGVSTWLDPDKTPGDPCRRRIIAALLNAHLMAFDAATGALCTDFGTDGIVDLNRDLVNNPAYPSEYHVTSPPAILRDLIIVGSSIDDNQRHDTPSGVVRAFDARTGRERWRWDPIPRRPDQPGYDTWHNGSAQTTGSANAWSVISVDAERDLVFLPIGSASPDFYGGERLGQNLYANSVVALRGATGERVWHFQVVHHDLWDYDVPAQPVLATLTRDGVPIPVVIQATKMGHLFVLHRETGEPLFPVEERPVPASTVPGEEAWPTQPFPVVPEPLVPNRLAPDGVWALTDADRTACEAMLDGLRSEGIFTPPSLEGTLIYPGNIGGSNWGGIAVDPGRELILAPTNNVGTIVRLFPRADSEKARRTHPAGEFGRQMGTPYTMIREWFLAPSRLPCNTPPWSTLTAIDLDTGRQYWKVPLGSMPGLDQVPGSEEWGSIVLGGVLTTAGGVTFAAGTLDEHLRAFDTETGRHLWKTRLPAGGNASPMSFAIDGRQYIVIAAGGHHRLGTTLGDYVVAFALPAQQASAEPPSNQPLTGTFAGDLIVGRRYPVELDLEETDSHQLTGQLRGIESRLTGTFSGERSADTLTFTIAFDFPEESCAGQLNGHLAWANHQTLLVGEIRVTGSCTEGDEEHGTLTLRRQ